MENTRNTNLIGSWSAIAAFVTSGIYSIFQILLVMKITSGSMGNMLVYAPSLFIAPSFLMAMVCLHSLIKAEEKKIFGQLGVVFAILYSVLVIICYVTQTLTVLPAEMRGEGQSVALLAFETGKFMMWIDTVGYFFMGISTLFMSFAMGVGPLERKMKLFMLMNGIIAPSYILAGFFPVFLALGALWMVAVPAAMYFTAAYFRKNLK